MFRAEAHLDLAFQALADPSRRAMVDRFLSDFERVLQVNLLGPFRLSKVLAGSMALRGGGATTVSGSGRSMGTAPVRAARKSLTEGK